MVRPKASEENLKIALGFAKSITLSCSDVKNSGYVVRCKGSASLFSALSLCLPKLVRGSVVNGAEGRESISEIEFNKYLAQNSFTKLRCRNRIPGTRNKWDKEYLRWNSVRWMNPNEPEDLEMLKSRLDELINCHPCTSSLDHDSLLSFLSRACSSIPENSTSSDSGSEGALTLSRPNIAGDSYDIATGENCFRPFSYPCRMPNTPLRCKRICNCFFFLFLPCSYPLHGAPSVEQHCRFLYHINRHLMFLSRHPSMAASGSSPQPACRPASSPCRPWFGRYSTCAPNTATPPSLSTTSSGREHNQLLHTATLPTRSPRTVRLILRPDSDSDTTGSARDPTSGRRRDRDRDRDRDRGRDRDRDRRVSGACRGACGRRS
jgi:hypothetical protein